MTKKQKQEWAINKAVSILTCDNPIPGMKIMALMYQLEQEGMTAMVIASEYSPEPPMRWQDLLKDQAA
jgi:hypothetical protein